MEPGYKYNLSDIHAAIAVVQLRRLPEINARRQALVASYHKALAHLPLQPLALPHYSHQHAWHLFMVRVDEERCGISRDQLMACLKDMGIGSGLHFRAVHSQNIIANVIRICVCPTRNGTQPDCARYRFSPIC